MKDLLYAEFDFSQYDPLANINAILEEIAQKNLDIEEIAATMEELGNATPEKVAQIDVIEREIQKLKKRADYYLAHLTKLWHDRLWEDIYNIASTARGVEADNNTIRVEFDSRGFNYAQIELNAINKCRYEYGLVSDDDSNNSESYDIPPYYQPLQRINNYGYVDLDKAYDVFTKLIEKLAYWITRSECSSLYLS